MQVRRGFHRIGMVGLVPFAVLAAASFAFAGYLWRAERGDALEVAGVAAALVAAGALWYLACWALGWIIAGFRNE